MFLREWRLERGWSQNKLSDVSGVSQTHISCLEARRKEAGLAIAQKLADGLGISLQTLLNRAPKRQAG